MPGLGKFGIGCCCCNDIYTSVNRKFTINSRSSVSVSDNTYGTTTAADFNPVHKFIFTKITTNNDPNFDPIHRKYSEDLGTLEEFATLSNRHPLIYACDPDNNRVFYTAGPEPWVAGSTTRYLMVINDDGTGDTELVSFTVASLPHSGGGTENSPNIVNARGQSKLVVSYQDRAAGGNPALFRGHKIDTFNYDGTGQTTIYSTPLEWEVLQITGLEWDNTNDKVWFIETRATAPVHRLIRNMNIDGTNVQTVLTGPTVGSGKATISGIQWSNKHQKLFFEQYDASVSQALDDEGGLWSMNADGTEQTLVMERSAPGSLYSFSGRLRLGCGFETTGPASLG